MPRNGSGQFSLDPRYLVAEGETIIPAQHNPVLEDISTDLNTPRPIVAGGTGATTAATARTNLSVYSRADTDTGFTKKAATRTVLKALDTATNKACVLTESGRQKLFMWTVGDFTSAVAGDPNEFLYIPADGVAVSIGCWVAVTGSTDASITPIAQGGTGAPDAATALANLGGLSGSDAGTTGLSLLGDETAEDARATLNVKEINADGGFSFSDGTGPINANTTITGVGTAGLYEFNHGRFGGLFDNARARTVFNNTTDTGLSAETGPRFAVAITHESEGNANSLAGNTHCGLWVYGGKADWLNNVNKGDHSATYFMTQNGRKGNGASVNMAAYKVFTGDTGVDEGGAMCFEGSGAKVDSTGAVQDVVQIYGGYVYDGGSASATHPLHGKLVGFSTEYQAGTDGYAAFAAISRASSSGAPKWENIFSAMTDRAGTEYFRITGDGNADPAGLVQAGNGSAVRPALSFLSNRGVGIWRPSVNNMAFSTNGVEQARFDASGNFLIGTATPFVTTVGTQDGFTIQKTGIAHISVSGASSLNIRRQVSDGNVEAFYRDTTVVGGISVTATDTFYNTASDGRLKTNSHPLEGAGAVIDALAPVAFDWKHAKGKSGVGFIAQDLAEVVPGAVKAGDDDPETITEQWQVDMSKLVPYLVAEIKALRARLSVLEEAA